MVPKADHPTLNPNPNAMGGSVLGCCDLRRLSVDSPGSGAVLARALGSSERIRDAAY